jgi:hypothetical protein
MSHIIEVCCVLSGISLAVIAFEIHVLNKHSFSEMKEKLNFIVYKLENSWTFPKT